MAVASILCMLADRVTPQDKKLVYEIFKANGVHVNGSYTYRLTYLYCYTIIFKGDVSHISMIGLEDDNVRDRLECVNEEEKIYALRNCNYAGANIITSAKELYWLCLLRNNPDNVSGDLLHFDTIDVNDDPVTVDEKEFLEEKYTSSVASPEIQIDTTNKRIHEIVVIPFKQDGSRYKYAERHTLGLTVTVNLHGLRLGPGDMLNVTRAIFGLPQLYDDDDLVFICYYHTILGYNVGIPGFGMSEFYVLCASVDPNYATSNIAIRYVQQIAPPHQREIPELPDFH